MASAIRTLRADEREALLELLDGWDVGDGWRGRDFFARYVDFDPTFAPENVWVAEDGGRLVSCVQVFPRSIRVRGRAVPIGGIGSVFTRPDARGSGLAGAVMRRCHAAMAARGMELALLFAGPVGFYESLGWRSWELERRVLVRGAALPPASGAGAQVSPFDAARDLDDVVRLHDAHDAPLAGPALRSADFTRAALRFAGNPAEDFLVARDAQGLAAYARGIVLAGFYVVSELARRPDAAEVLADLVLHLLAPREPDPLAPSDKSSEALRAAALAPQVADPELFRALAARGVETRGLDDRGSMLHCLAPDALARRLAIPRLPDEPPNDYLARLLPPTHFTFWPSDRFCRADSWPGLVRSGRRARR